MSDNSADQPTNENAPDQPATQPPYPTPTIDFGDAPVTAPQQPSYGQPPEPVPSDGGIPPYVGTPYGAPNQPTDPSGAPQQPTPPYGAPQQPAPPYGAPQQPAPPYGAPQQPLPPYATLTQPAAPYGGPAVYPGAPAGPGGPGTPTYGSTVVPDRPNRTGLIVGLIIAGVAVLAIIVVIIALVIGSIRGSAAHDGTPLNRPANGDASAAAEEAVQGYFDALIDSDSKKALSYLDDTAGLDKTFLTDEVLEYSNKLAPITDVEIDTDDVRNYGGYATVDFMVGDNAVSEDFLISIDKKGRAKLASYNMVQTLYLSQNQFALELNGIPLTTDSADLFFGVYRVTPVNKNFTLPGGGEFAVTPLNASLPRSSEIQLTDDARAKVIKTVSAAVTECLAEKTVEAGCGLSLDASDAGDTVTEVTRSMDEDSLSRLADPTIDVSYDAVGVEVTDFGSVDFAATCTKDGATAPCQVYSAPDFYRVTVDMSGETWKLTWENF